MTPGSPQDALAAALEDSQPWMALCQLLDEMLPLLDEPYSYRDREKRLDERMRWFGRAEAMARAALDAADAAPGLDVPVNLLVRALYISGLTDDMNPVDRRKAALRLRDAIREMSARLAAQPVAGEEGA